MISLSIVDEIYEKLQTRILSKEWTIGDKIPSESQLCKEFGASRITIRSAVQKLQMQGLIVTRPGKGSFVISNEINVESGNSTTKLNFSQNEYRFFIEFRRAIEFYCVDLICERGLPEDFEQLKKGLDMMKNSQFKSEEFKQGDLLFHASIIRGSHNPMFISILDSSIHEYVKYMAEVNVEKPNSYDVAIDNHTKIYNALVSRDAKKAKIILDSTIEFNIRKLKNVFSD